MDAAIVAPMILGLLCQIAFGTLIGAVIVRAACWLLNRFSGASPLRRVSESDQHTQFTTVESGPYTAPSVVATPAYSATTRVGQAVPEPNFGKASLISFATLLVAYPMMFIFVVVIESVEVSAGHNPALLLSFFGLLAIPIILLVHAGLLTLVLPTTFGRGLSVALFGLLVSVAIGVAVVALFVGADILFSRAAAVSF